VNHSTNQNGKIQLSLQEKLKAVFLPTHLEVINESASHHRNPEGESHFKLVIVSESFQGKSRVERQRMVQDLFDEERAEGLHALTMTTLTKQEWEAQKIKPRVASPTCLGGDRQS
jgi:BolA protein